MEASRSLAFDKPIINPEVRLAGMCPLHEHMDNSSGASSYFWRPGDQKGSQEPLMRDWTSKRVVRWLD